MAAGAGPVADWIEGLIAAPIDGAIGLVLLVGVVHPLVRLVVGPDNAGFAATFRVASYTAVMNLTAWLPLVGPLVGLCGIYLAIVGIREVLGTTTGNAVA